MTFWVRITRRRLHLIEPNNKVLYQIHWLTQLVCSVGWALDYRTSWCWLPRTPQQHYSLLCSVDGSTTMFSKQHSDSVAPWLWVWLTQLISSRVSSPLTQSAWFGCATLQLLSTNSTRFAEQLLLWLSRVAESDSSSSGTDSFPQLSKGLLSRCSRSPSTNSARVCWAAATMTQRTALSQTLSRYVHDRGTQY